MTERHQDPHALIREAAEAPQRTEQDLVHALRALPAARAEDDRLECALIERAMDTGASWERLAAELGARSGDALRVRYRRLGGRRSWPSGPKTTK